MSTTGDRRRAPSINDVAALARVSSKTVSNVLHGKIRVADATKARVESAIRELGYQPDPHARRLRSGRSGILAVAVPHVHVPYFAELISHLVRAARARGYTVLVDETSGSDEHEADIVTGIAPRLADGLILSSQGTDPARLGRIISDVSARTPIVLIGEHAFGLPVDHVLIDNAQAGRDATEHLIAMGRRRIAAIGLPAGYDDQQEHASLRLRGYRRALEAARLPFDLDLVMPAGARRPEDGAAAVRALLELRPTPDALFCFTDLLALGAVRRLHEQGVRVPDEIAVIGVDGIMPTQYQVPSISTIAPDKAMLAEKAVGLLDDRIGGDDRPPLTLYVGHKLMTRESTGSA